VWSESDADVMTGQREMEIEDQITAKNILFTDTVFNDANDASFLEKGIIYSVGVTELVAYVGQLSA